MAENIVQIETEAIEFEKLLARLTKAQQEIRECYEELQKYSVLKISRAEQEMKS